MYEAVMAPRERVSVAPVIVLVVIVPMSDPEASAMPPPEEPSCAAAEPPRASTSTVFVPKVKTFFIEPNTTVGYNADRICWASRNCAAKDAIATGVPADGGVWASDR